VRRLTVQSVNQRSSQSVCLVSADMSSAIVTRSCLVESRWRIVTARSFSVSKSTVMKTGCR